jgi:hypothetical protein
MTVYPRASSQVSRGRVLGDTANNHLLLEKLRELTSYDNNNNNEDNNSSKYHSDDETAMSLYDSSSSSEDISSEYDDDDDSDSDESDLEEIESLMKSIVMKTSKPAPSIISHQKDLINFPQHIQSRIIQSETAGYSYCSEAAATRGADSTSTSTSNSNSTTIRSTPSINKQQQQAPQEYLNFILQEQGCSMDMFTPKPSSYLVVCQKYQRDYAPVAAAARTEDLDELRLLHHVGACLQSCNGFGESVVHIVCRRGSLEILQFLTQEANVSVRVRDDVGRTPLFDAAWTDTPNFALVQMLLQHSPDFLFVRDKRGHSALSYVPKQRWGEWVDFLHANQSLIQDAINSKNTLCEI